ncbi:hypothetical protein VN97_g13309, partial [Penicillium thymicola]
MGGKRKKGSSAWVDPNFDHVELEPRAHAKTLLKITQQWKAAADEGGIPPHYRFVKFLDAVTSLTTRMRDSEMLQELGRIRALLSYKDTSNHQPCQYFSNPPTYLISRRTRESRESQSSLVSGWMSRTQTNGTSVPSNDLSSSSSASAPVMMREHLQLTVRGTDR